MSLSAVCLCRRDFPCNSSALEEVAHGSDKSATVKGSATAATPSQPPFQPPCSATTTATVQANPSSDYITALISRLQACTTLLDTNLDLSLEERVTVYEIGLETIRRLRSQLPLQRPLQPPLGVGSGETATVHALSGRCVCALAQKRSRPILPLPHR